MNQGCDVTGDLTHRRPRTIQLCHLAPWKLKLSPTNLFSRSPVITFTSGRIPCLMMSLATLGVQLTWRHKKTSYTLLNSISLQLLIHTKGAYQKSGIASQTVGIENDIGLPSSFHHKANNAVHRI